MKIDIKSSKCVSHSCVSSDKDRNRKIIVLNVAKILEFDGSSNSIFRVPSLTILSML